MAKKSTNVIRFISYRKHVIWYDKEFKVYSVALKRNRKDDYFSTYEEAMDAIDELEDK